MKVLSLLAFISLTHGQSILTHTHCEYHTGKNAATDSAAPRFGWVIESKEQNTIQSSYEVMVASSPDLLEKNNADLWQSGKVNSDESVHVTYAGKPLQNGITYFWKARIEDNHQKQSAWSDVKSFTCGLQAGDWQAKWIRGADDLFPDVSHLYDMNDCSWVWVADEEFGKQAAGKAYFRKEIEISSLQEIQSAVMIYTGDDEAKLKVNGTSVTGEHKTWKTLARIDIRNYLRTGKNVLAIEAKNTDAVYAGVLGKCVISFADKKDEVINVDDTWLASRTPMKDWDKTNVLGMNWKNARSLAKHGAQPWGVVNEAKNQIKPPSYFRKTFSLTKNVKHASLFATARGAYELFLNGKPVSDDVLSPGWTDFNKRINYHVYDVTTALQKNENIIAAILGDGWFSSYVAYTGVRNFYGKNTSLLMQLRIDYDDGTSETIVTDGSWKSSLGGIRSADNLMGCDYDAREEKVGWNQLGYDDKTWDGVALETAPKANITLHAGEPMKRIEEVTAKNLTEPQKGVYVFDLKQNMVGWAKIKIKGKAGQTITVRHAEMLNKDGTLYTTNLRTAAATDTYVLADDKQHTYEPHFTFHGFQYVEITGLDYKPQLSDVIGVVVNSALPETSTFTCSEPLVNQVVRNSVWGQKGNFLDIPTDCPQRNERAGWTGDAQVFMKTACLNMYSPAFFTKWLRDLCTDGQAESGAFPDTAPSFDKNGNGNAGWTDAGPICTWRMYEMYGDKVALREHYAACKKHFDFLTKTSNDSRRNVAAFGDWLRLMGPQKSDCIGTAYYAYDAQIMQRIAATLGETDDAKMYQAAFEKIRERFIHYYLKPDGKIIDEQNEECQTFYALAFGIGLLPDEMMKKSGDQFAAIIAKQDGHIQTGFLGTPMILFALQKAGHTEIAYQLALNKTYPSWLQQVLWGSTTMWERWDGWRPDKGFQDAGMNSFNHYWLGCITEWLITQVAGIDTSDVGFKKIKIEPHIIPSEKSFSWVKSNYQSIRGNIASEWKQENGKVTLHITIPANTTALVVLPENAKSQAIAKPQKIENAKAYFETGSGDYTFTW